MSTFLSFSEIMDSAVAALDADRGLVGSNHAFNALLDEGDGLRMSGGSLSAAAQDDVEKLSVSLSAITHSPRANSNSAVALPAQFFSIRRCGRAALNCVMVPSGSLFGSAETDAAAILFVSDPECCPQQSIERVCALYQLTPTETQLALYLVQGYNTADIAMAMNLKEETIRAYLKHIYTKTETNRQPELVQLLLASRLPLIIPGPQQLVGGTSRRRH